MLAGCGGGSSTGGHDSPQAAAQGFLTALGAFDGSPNSLQTLLDWVPPSKRTEAQQNFAGLEAQGSGETTRFRVDGLQINNATTDGDNATVSVAATLSICVSGSVSSQAYSTCRPAPISPTGAFDKVTCAREGGQWYVVDYESSTGAGAGSAPGTSGSDTSPAASASTAASS
ncbi:MAG TPA: hypothetical protein VFO60_10505 [Candidatus Dormibacteraeota bacterium]|nr:hypothetical protein [Candidatus Dormibacteraeota bacterium]